MTWPARSGRRQALPRNWSAIRRVVLDRDGRRCTYLDPTLGRCPLPATDVHHVNDGDDHSSGNLVSLCGPHHRSITAAESVVARRSSKRSTSPHPGLRPGEGVADTPPRPPSAFPFGIAGAGPFAHAVPIPGRPDER